jgi:hypothetical protein
MSSITVNWFKCGDDKHWCDFYRLDLSKNLDGAAGVYVIFYLGSGTKRGRVVRVGQGNVANRLAAHREDSEISAHKNKGLLVTWARVHGQQHNGVEKYLSDVFKPLVGERFPNRTPIEVNSPFA